jgi:hypothetical protein
MAEIIIAEDFTENPGLRHCSISDDSGEDFYHTILNETFYNSFSKGDILTINLDGSSGYAPSFLDEAFGNLVYDFSLESVNKFLIIISNDEPEWVDYLKTETFKQWEQRRIINDTPKKTASHSPWYRLVEDSLVKKVW